MNIVKPLYLFINKINSYIEESNGNKSLTLVLADRSIDILKKYGELWSKIKDLIRLITNLLHNAKFENYPQGFLDECLYKLWILEGL